MKSFLWRMRSNIGWFSATIVMFTAIYIVIALTATQYLPESNTVRCLDGIDPSVICGGMSFAFFLIYTKRYTYDEAYLYGQSRKGAFASSVCAAAVYAFMFACYALGFALIMRRSVLSADNIAVSNELYGLTAGEIILNLLLLTVINMIAYEIADLLRNFKSWKFWITIIVCAASFVVLYVFIVVLPTKGGKADFDFWSATFSVLVPQLFIMIAGDVFMTRGRQNR